MQGRGRILAQPKVKADYELIVGYLHDAIFGDCLMLGMGGLLAELVPDVAFTLAPLRPGGAQDMLARLKTSRLFQGFRSLAPLDLEALADLLARLGQGGRGRGRGGAGGHKPRADKQRQAHGRGRHRGAQPEPGRTGKGIIICQGRGVSRAPLSPSGGLLVRPLFGSVAGLPVSRPAKR